MLPSNRTLVRDMDVRRFYSHRVALVSAVLLVRTLLLWASGADATSSEDFNNNTCVVSSPCELELGIAFGNPWLTVKTGDVKYFQVGTLGEQGLQQQREIVVLTCTNKERATLL